MVSAGVPFLTALVFTSYYAVLPVLQRDWGMSGVEAGRIGAGFQVGYAISLVAWNVLDDVLETSDRYPILRASVLPPENAYREPESSDSSSSGVSSIR